MFVGALKYQCRPCECSRGHKGANKGRENANRDRRGA